MFRKHYGLAIQIAKHLKLPESRILEHWAFHKVTYDKSMQIFYQQIIFSNIDRLIRSISEHCELEQIHYAQC